MAASDALEKMLDDCDAKVLFLSDQYRSLVEPYETRIAKLIAGGRIAYDFRRAGWRDFDTWLAPASDAPFEVPLGPLDDFNIIYSSGTTGLPKIVMHHQARWFAFDRFADRIAGFGASDVFLSALPAPFGFGLWTAHFSPAIAGAPCVVIERFTAETVCAAIEEHGVTVLAAVSTQFLMMLQSPAFAAHDLSSLRVAIHAAAPCRIMSCHANYSALAS